MYLTCNHPLFAARRQLSALKQDKVDTEHLSSPYGAWRT